MENDNMEPTMDEKLQACIELCEEGDPEMCAFLGKEFYYGWILSAPCAI